MALKRIWFRGVLLNKRTRDMILAAEKIAGFPFVLTQGSYNRGGVAASAGTHDGGGAVDVHAAGYTSSKQQAIVAALREVGFAAWLRTPAQADWPYHVHAEAVGDPELSAGARRQITQYMKGTNGLASKGKDDGPRTWVGVTWESYQAGHQTPPGVPDPVKPQPEDDMWEPAAAEKIEKRYVLADQLWRAQTAAEQAVSNAYAALLLEGKDLPAGVKIADVVAKVEGVWKPTQVALQTQLEELNK